ncbi:MAG: efflux RND transporter periplasmic adaptor subunit [Armatimonadota bacterium]|nr:efflux RND transporter periplasmic adaptor subunit [Armatimonadota bacterium]
MAKSKRAKRRMIYIIVAVVLVVIAIVARSRQSAGNKPIIRTASVERGTVTASVSANGVLQPLTTIEVKSNVGGQIVKLSVDEGDTVKAGQLIARIDPTDTATALEQSQADLASARSKVDQARLQQTMQHTQNVAQVDSARQGLASARARLAQAEDQAGVQPTLTNASINQAKSNLASAEASLKQTKTASIPQKLASAQSAYNQAKATVSTSEKDLARQRELLSQGFVAKSVVEASEERYEVAKAQLDSAKSKLDTIKDETDQDLSVAQSRVQQAKAELDNATANRVQDKLKRQELIAAQAAARQSEANLQSAIATRYVDRIRGGDIVQAGAQVKRSQASVTNARKQLDYTTIIAPRNGIVVKKYVEEGSIVTAGRSSFSGAGSGVSIVDIADTTQMFALVSVDETDIAQIEVGQEVDVTVEAYPDELFTGKVTKIAPQSVTDQNVTTIPVTVEIDLPDQRLKPGMNVTCDFITGRASDVLMVPSEAVNESDHGNTVTILNGDEQIPRKVKTGLVGSDNTEIKRGLKRGEKVVTAIIEPTVPGNMNNGGMGGQGRTGGQGRPGGFGGPGGLGGGGGMRRGF